MGKPVEYLDPFGGCRRSTSVHARRTFVVFLRSQRQEYRDQLSRHTFSQGGDADGSSAPGDQRAVGTTPSSRRVPGPHPPWPTTRGDVAVRSVGGSGGGLGQVVQGGVTQPRVLRLGGGVEEWGEGRKGGEGGVAVQGPQRGGPGRRR